MTSHHTSMVEIAPSILSADFARLAEEIQAVERAGASLLHVDVMDGRFVPNITIGLPVVKAISRATRLPLDAHLMIVEPGRYAEQFVAAGAQWFQSISKPTRTRTGRCRPFGRRADRQASQSIRQHRFRRWKKSSNSRITCLLMSVNPGFGGQKFIPESLDKLRRLRSMIDERGLNTRIEIDGGIDATTSRKWPRPELKSSSQARQFSRQGSRRRPSRIARSDSSLGLAASAISQRR